MHVVERWDDIIGQACPPHTNPQHLTLPLVSSAQVWTESAVVAIATAWVRFLTKVGLKGGHLVVPPPSCP